MADKTGIEWTEATWNPIAGCSVISPGCTNCYAMRDAGGRLRSSAKFAGLTEPSKAGPVWNGQVRLWERALDAPLRWSKPRRIFVNSMSDLFHEAVPDAWIDRIFDTMELCPRHTFQVLTKRSARMRDYVTSRLPKRAFFNRLVLDTGWPPSNAWLGVSAEDQQRYDERKDVLATTPAAIVKWWSLEPLLGPIDLGQLRYRAPGNERIFDWVVVGGESGPGARPMHVEWARSIVAQCRAADVPVFVKQLGARVYQRAGGGRQRLLFEDRKGGDPAEWPEDLRVREYP